MPQIVFIYMQIFLHSPMLATSTLLPGKVMGPKLSLRLKGPTNLDAMFSNLFLQTAVQGGAVANQCENDVIFLFLFPENCSYSIPLKNLIMLMIVWQFIFLI